MRLTALSILAAASLLALLIVSLFWIRSDRFSSVVEFDTPGNVRPATAVENAQPATRITAWRFAFAGVSVANEIAFLHHDTHQDTHHDDHERDAHNADRSHGLGQRNGNVVDGLRIEVPYWLLFVLSALLPFVWIVRQRRSGIAEMRREAGLCMNCGYDLRASAGLCPECGMGPAHPQP